MAEESKVLGKLGSGEPVVDRHRTHLREDVAGILPAALTAINSEDRSFFVQEVDFHRPVGETICVPVQPGDHIVYARRPNRRGLTRFVKGREPATTSSVTIALMRGDDRTEEGPPYYVLISAFFGGKAEPETWDIQNFEKQPDAREAARLSYEFWARYALVWGRELTVNDELIEFPPLPVDLADPGDYTAVLEQTFALGKERHPNATPQHHAAFANAVLHAVTGMSGGYGGPSLREHLACRQTIGGGLSYRDAILAVEEISYGPITRRHAAMIECEESHFDDPPGDIEAALEFLSPRK